MLILGGNFLYLGKKRTAGHLVFLIAWPAAGHLDTSYILRKAAQERRFFSEVYLVREGRWDRGRFLKDEGAASGSPNPINAGGERIEYKTLIVLYEIV